MDQINAGVASISGAAREVLARARELDAGGDAAVAEAVREVIVAVGRAAQTLHGLLLALVGEGDRLVVARGGIGPWLATVLDLTEGRARALAHDARILTSVPEIEEEVCSGRVGQDSARAIARTVKAVRGTDLDPAGEAGETLRVACTKGAKAGLERVRVLEEHVDPGSIEQRHARQRERSHARIGIGDSGMHRCEILLDPLRGTILQAAIELQVADMIRARQYDGVEVVPDDVRSTEQMNAEAITRMAQVFLDAPPTRRTARFSIPTLAVTLEKDSAADPEIPSGCARTVYGELVPAGLLPKADDPKRHHLVLDGDGGTLDGAPVDQDPSARLASSSQRGYLAWRDRHCRFPGCDRPITYALHAHHTIPYAEGGQTSVGNMRLYCAHHHTVIHQR